MTIPRSTRVGVLTLLLLHVAGQALAQSIESVGTRALGMGGAFVAVANDSSATWWNPAGLAAGPFLDLGLGRAVTSASGRLPARRDTTSSFAVTTPPFGFSFYRLRLSGAEAFDPTGGDAGDRQDRRAGAPIHSLAVNQVGVTLVQTLISGVHIGTTLKVLRGEMRSGREDATTGPSTLLDAADDLDGGDADTEFDLDVGLHATAGAVSVAAVVRNIREPEFAEGADLPITGLTRQVRVGAAFDGDRIGRVPVTVAIDADLRSYATGTGDRRVVAVGAEQWFAAKRVAVRAGARFNTVGAEDRTATGGVSLAVRPGFYVDGYAAVGGDAGERGWGVTVRVSF
jgi:hypothetical protein